MLLIRVVVIAGEAVAGRRIADCKGISLMRRLIVLAGLLLTPAAIAQVQPTPPEKPLYRFPGLPDEPVAGPDRRSLGPRGQLFVSPAGQPFRAEPGTPYPSVTWFAQADTDHDGKIDRTEFSADFDRFFAILDINHDGAIDPPEIARYERDVLPEVAAGDGSFGGLGPGGRPRGGRGGRRSVGDDGLRRIAGGSGSGAGQDGGGQAPARRTDDLPILGAGRYGLINIPEPVTSMDINLDGTITAYESRQAAVRRFTLLDPDRHGALKLGELPYTPAQRSGEGNRRRRDRDDR